MKLALVLAILGSGAAAESCPKIADLETGVLLTQTSPMLSMVYVQTADGLTEARAPSADASPATVDTIYSHPLTPVARLVNGNILGIDYAEDVSALDNLAETQRWETAVTLTHNGDVFTMGTYTAVFLRTDWVPLSECAYDVWILRDLLMLDNGAAIHTEKRYAPSLGLVLGSIELDAQNQPTGSIIFNEIAAE